MSADRALKRCSWANPNNPRYLRYHDEEWGVACHDDQKLCHCESFFAALLLHDIITTFYAESGQMLFAIKRMSNLSSDATTLFPGLRRTSTLLKVTMLLSAFSVTEP